MTVEEILLAAEEMTGSVIADRYRLDSVLGLGGTGVVYRAQCLVENTPVAVKTIRRDLVTDRAIARFFRGARLAAGLNHVGVVPTLAYGQSKSGMSTPFQVMPLVEGPSLKNLAMNQLSHAEIIWLGCRILDALAFVHARGVLHRDIKPANILLERQTDGTLIPRITDFGIAAALLGGLPDMNITGRKTLVGTPGYMAPEQAQPGAMNGPQLDLYALGVVLFQMLSGRLPFKGPAMEVLAAKSTRDPPPLEVPGLDPAIASAIGKLIARDPRDRYPLAAQARCELEPHAQELVVDMERMASLLSARRVLPTVAAPDHHPWNPPGEKTIESHWPTLVLPVAPSAKLIDLPGRKQTLHSLQQIARVVEGGEVRIVSVVGEPGMGKTAVLEHVAADLVEQGRFLVLRAPYFEGGAQPGGIRRGIERMLGVHGLDREQVAVAVREILERYDDVWPDEVDQLVDCLRPPTDRFPEALIAGRGEQIALVVRLLRRLAQTRPILLLVDNAEKASADLGRFLEYMLMEARFDPWPVMVLCGVSLPAEESSFWQTVQRSEVLRSADHKRLNLHPIPNEALEQELIRRLQLTPAEAHRIVRQAGGNPLHANYLAEVFTSATSTIEPDEDATQSGVRVALPNALLDLMERRLAQHLKQADDPVQARALLEALAVLGDAAEEDLLQQILPPEQQARFEQTLDSLLTIGVLGIVDRAEPMVLGFTPGLLREAVLASSDEAHIHELHERAAMARLGLERGRRRAHWGAIGEHYAALGKIKEAHQCWMKGVLYELSSGDVMRGVAWGRRALEHLEQTDPTWAYTALQVAIMMLDAGEAESAEDLMRIVLETGDVDQSLQAGDLLCDLLENRGDPEEWRTLVDRMSALEEHAGPVGRCALYSARSMWQSTYGQPADALADAQRALQLAEPGPPAQRAAQRLAFANLPHMQLDAAYAAAKRSLQEAGAIPLLRARSLRTLGTVQVWQGNAAAAVETLEEAAALCRQAGLLNRYPIAVHDLGDAYRLTGQYPKARGNYAEAIRLATGLPLESTVALTHFKLAICDISEGRAAAALNNIDQLILDGTQAGLGMSKPFGALLRCWAYSVTRDLPSALEAYTMVGPLHTIHLDPQIPEILIDTSERLVGCLLSTEQHMPHLANVQQICLHIRDTFGGAGDTERLQRADRLLRRLPSIPT